MSLAIELYFDDESDRRVRNLCSELKSSGIPVPSHGEFRPHISVATVAQEHVDAAKKAVENLAANTVKFSSSLTAVGTFPGDEGVVFLTPSLSDGLMSIHRRTDDEFETLRVPVSPLYSRGQWVPHCTVGIHVPSDQVPKAVSICRDAGVFGPIVVNGMLILDTDEQRVVLALDFS